MACTAEFSPPAETAAQLPAVQPPGLPVPCAQAGVRDKAKEVSVELCAYLGQVRLASEAVCCVWARCCPQQT